MAFNMTDTEFGLVVGFNRAIGDVEYTARIIIQRQNNDIANLRRHLAEAQRAMALERSRRMAAEVRLDVLLSTPGVGPGLRRRLDG